MNYRQQALQSEELKGACCGAMSECQSLFNTRSGPARDLKELLGCPQEYEHDREMYRNHSIINQWALDQRQLSNGKQFISWESWRSCCKQRGKEPQYAASVESYERNNDLRITGQARHLHNPK